MHAMNEPFNYPDSSIALNKLTDNLTNTPCETNDLVNRLGGVNTINYMDLFNQACDEKAKLEETIKQYDEELSKAYHEIRMLKSIIRAIEAVTGKHIYD